MRQTALKGHLIAFQHSGPNAINICAQLLFPWFNIDEVVQCIRVAFVGPSARGSADQTLKALCIDGGLLRADLRPLSYWLGLLKAVHPGYSHIVLPSDPEATQSQLLNMQRMIVDGAQRVHSRLSRRIERKAVGADIAKVRSLPEDHDLQSSDDDEDAGSDSDSSSSSSNSDKHDTEQIVEIDDPLFSEKLNLILSHSIIVDGSSSTDQSARNIMSNLLSTIARDPDTGNVPDAHIHSVRSEEPINEMGNCDILFYMAFPDLFPFGRGLPTESHAFPAALVRHLLLQFTCKHAQNARFVYANFNILQRHKVASLAACRVRNSKPAIQEFLRLIHEDNFLARLSAAVENPEAEESKLLTKQVLPLISNFGSSVPYSPSERRDMFSRMVASFYRFGTGFIFASAAFDDRRHVFAVRLSIPSTSNHQFPAIDNGFRQQMENCKETFNEEGTEFTMPIDDVTLLKLVSENPAGAVQFFKILFEAFLEILVGVPPSSQSRTVPINHQSKNGLFGIVTDVSIVNECNGR